MDDLRWFSPNPWSSLPVSRLRAAGLTVAEGGNAPARLALAIDAQGAVAGYEFSRRVGCPLVLYLWDVPHWRLGSGRPDHIFMFGGRVRRIPRVLGRFPERPGYYSRVLFVARRATEVWCPSLATQAALAQRLGLTAIHLPFCYDSDRFHPGAAGSGSARQGILVVSRLVAYKRHDLVLRAAARLTPIPPVRMLGEGPQGEPLRALARELGVPLELPNRRASHDELVAAFRTAAVVVSASEFEGFGITPMEGAAMGAPVIASDIPPHREFLSAVARFFPPGDADGLAAALRSALQGAPPPLPVPHPLPEVGIEACTARFLPRIRRLLDGAA